MVLEERGCVGTTGDVSTFEDSMCSPAPPPRGPMGVCEARVLRVLWDRSRTVSCQKLHPVSKHASKTLSMAIDVHS